MEGVTVRMESNANIVNRTGTNVSSSIVASAKANTTINEFKTNTQGRMISNRYSTNGGSTFVDGYFDYTQSLNVATAGATSFGDTQAGQSLADGVGIFPLQVWRAGTGFETTNNIDVRAYSHDIDIDNNTNISDYSVGDFIPIDTNNVVGAPLEGVRIKTANINADNTHNFDSFTADTPVSLNDIANAVRAGWAQYYVDVDTTKQTGAFDETTYPIRLHIRQAPETGGNQWQEDEFGMKVAGFGGGGQFRVAVLGNGLANADDDLFNTLPGVRSLNFAGLPLSDVTLTAQERLVDMGNVTNAILTAGDDAGGDPETSSLRYDLFFDNANVQIRGNTTLTSGVNRPLTEADINLPTVVGTTYVDDDGVTIEPNITITRGTLIQSIGTERTSSELCLEQRNHND